LIQLFLFLSRIDECIGKLVGHWTGEKYSEIGFLTLVLVAFASLEGNFSGNDVIFGARESRVYL
jgi:hypothetical protein